MKFITKYLFLSGISAHLFVIGLLFFQPHLVNKMTSKIMNKYYSWQKNNDYDALTHGDIKSLPDEISSVFLPWKPDDFYIDMTQAYAVNGVPFTSISKAIAALKDGDELLIAAGTYHSSIVITQNNITIKGVGHVIFDGGVTQGKGLILSKGNNLTVQNIECKNISVRDGNGACIRQEGVNLTLQNVFFHQSQEGVLETAREPGIINIYNSRFERLGYKGQAHGIYTNKAELYIEKSLFIAAKSEGHAIKVRGSKLSISSSIITSLSSDDSRLIDMPNGGELQIKNSLLAQGPNSVNGQMIGFGLEGITQSNNNIQLVNNLVYLERLGANILLALPKQASMINVIQDKNMIIGKDTSDFLNDSNIYFSDRVELGLPRYPYLSEGFCANWTHCPIVKYSPEMN